MTLKKQTRTKRPSRADLLRISERMISTIKSDAERQGCLWHLSQAYGELSDRTSAKRVLDQARMLSLKMDGFGLSYTYAIGKTLGLSGYKKKCEGIYTSIQKRDERERARRSEARKRSLKRYEKSYLDLGVLVKAVGKSGAIALLDKLAPFARSHIEIGFADIASPILKDPRFGRRLLESMIPWKSEYEFAVDQVVTRLFERQQFERAIEYLQLLPTMDSRTACLALNLTDLDPNACGSSIQVLVDYLATELRLHLLSGKSGVLR